MAGISTGLTVQTKVEHVDPSAGAHDGELHHTAAKLGVNADRPSREDVAKVESVHAGAQAKVSELAQDPHSSDHALFGAMVWSDQTGSLLTHCRAVRGESPASSSSSDLPAEDGYATRQPRRLSYRAT